LRPDLDDEDGKNNYKHHHPSHGTYDEEGRRKKRVFQVTESGIRWGSFIKRKKPSSITVIRIILADTVLALAGAVLSSAMRTVPGAGAILAGAGAVVPRYKIT
jgi:hypothetical protein